jgi:hypothetical protein
MILTKCGHMTLCKDCNEEIKLCTDCKVKFSECLEIYAC